jgi:hypothetical protein
MNEMMYLVISTIDECGQLAVYLCGIYDNEEDAHDCAKRNFADVIRVSKMNTDIYELLTSYHYDEED